MENIEVIFDNESTTHGMSSYELALAHFNLFKFGPSIKQNGLSLDVTESELKSHGNSKTLKYSVDFSFTSDASNLTSLKLLKEISRANTTKLVGISKDCFYGLGGDPGEPWNVEFIYTALPSCSNEQRISLEEGFKEYPVQILESELVNQSARPDRNSLTADGELSFYFLMVDDMDEDNEEEVGDFINPEIDKYFSQVVDNEPELISDDITEYESQGLIPGVNVRVRVHRIRKDMEKHEGAVKQALNEYDVFSYNGHSYFGDSFIYDAIKKSTRSDYWVVQLNACWSSSFVSDIKKGSSSKSYDFIGHSETILFSTFPLMNQMLFQTVIEEKTYFSHLNQLEQALFNSKGDRLERLRNSGVKDVLPDTIVHERGI